ncbi:hypothetical protein V6N12_045391 [Hibiscus sabdariffa]|uniref:Secreted protein n=1 Tax=Hibiscus sabdariffa TaxID=183260 RepID=A0ABR2G2V2_9ROSI
MSLSMCAPMYGFSLWVPSVGVVPMPLPLFFCSSCFLRAFIFTWSSSTLKTISSLSKSIIAVLVDKNGLPRMIGAFSSASQSRIRKSVGKMNLSTCTRMSSIFPSG